MSPAKGSRISQPSFLLVSWRAWSGNAIVSSDSANGCTSCTHKLPSALQGSVPIERHDLWFNSKKIEHYVLFSFYWDVTRPKLAADYYLPTYSAAEVWNLPKH